MARVATNSRIEGRLDYPRARAGGIAGNRAVGPELGEARAGPGAEGARDADWRRSERDCETVHGLSSYSGERTRHRVLVSAPRRNMLAALKRTRKFAMTRRHRQHARRMRSPDLQKR